MKNIKTFKDFVINENIIDFDTENIRNFYNTLKEELRNSRSLSIKRMKDVALENDIEVVDYNTFYKELPDSQKSTAPPRYGPPAFALVNPVTHKARIVMSAEQLDRGLLEYIYHMLKHENVHVGQYNRGGLRGNMPDPKNQGEYFSNKHEVMAFAQSIVDMLKDTCDTKEEALKSLKSNRLYRDVKRSVDTETLKKYDKYIYLYLNKQYGEDELGDRSKISDLDKTKNDMVPIKPKINNKFIRRF